MEPNVHKLAQEIVQEILDRMKYEGKTFREWIEIFSKYPMKHGFWKDDRTSIVCSVCGTEFDNDISYCQKYPWTDENPKYCPNCGARMDVIPDDSGQ